MQWANRAAFVDVLATGARPLMQAWRARRAGRGGAEIAGGVGDGHVGVLGFDPGGLEVAGVGEQGGTPVA